MNSISSHFSLKLRELLERRLAVISDQDLRERDPALQMEQLRSVSEGITALYEEGKAELPPRLKHYLERASYQKALAWLKGEEE
jgi:hypothetical protein